MKWNVVVDVARPPRAVFLRGNKNEVESNSGSGEALMRLCFHGSNYVAACERSGSGIFHPVRWSAVLQQHFDVGSHMVVAFLVWCGRYFSRVPVDAGSWREVLVEAL